MAAIGDERFVVRTVLYSDRNKPIRARVQFSSPAAAQAHMASLLASEEPTRVTLTKETICADRYNFDWDQD